MSAEQLAMRLLAEVTGVPSDRLRKGEITASEYGRVRDAAIDIQSAPLFIDDTGGLSMARLAARSRRLKRQMGLDLIVVDYLQLLTVGDSSRNDNRVQEVTQITQGLKALAKELSVPVIACAQLSRQVENRDDKRPQLSDLRESGSIEQDADVVAFIHRESYYNRDENGQPDPDTENKAEIIIAKQRNGPTGSVHLAFLSKCTRFENLSYRDQDGY
jgi:replicative DNA helicase